MTKLGKSDLYAVVLMILFPSNWIWHRKQLGRMIYGQEEVDSGSIVEPLTVERYEVLFVCTEQLSTSNKHWKHCKFWRCQFWPLDTAHLHPTRVCAGIFRQPSWNQVTTDFLGMVGPIKMIPTAVSDKDRVGNSLLQTWKLRFGHKA